MIVRRARRRRGRSSICCRRRRCVPTLPGFSCSQQERSMEKIIPLPVPKHAYDPGRQMSSLLRSQVDLLQQAVIDAIDSKEEMAHTITVLADLLTRLRPQITQVRKLQSAVYDAIDTEAEAATCIRTLNGLLKELRPDIEPR